MLPSGLAARPRGRRPAAQPGPSDRRRPGGRDHDRPHRRRPRARRRRDRRRPRLRRDVPAPLPPRARRAPPGSPRRPPPPDAADIPPDGAGYRPDRRGRRRRGRAAQEPVRRLLQPGRGPAAPGARTRDRVVVYGVALEVCDRYAVEGMLALDAGFDIVVVEDAVAALDAARGAELLDDWRRRGVRVAHHRPGPPRDRVEGRGVNPDLLLAHYHEIGLKGRNRPRFERALRDNLERALGDSAGRVRLVSGRVEILDPKPDALERVTPGLRRGQRRPGARRPGRPRRHRRHRRRRRPRRRHPHPVRDLRGAGPPGPDRRSPTPARWSTSRSATPSASAWPSGSTCSHPDVSVRIEIVHDKAYVSAAKVPGPGGPARRDGRPGRHPPLGRYRLAGGDLADDAPGRRPDRRPLPRPALHRTAPRNRRSRQLIDVLGRWGYRRPWWSVPMGEAQREITLSAPSPLRVLLYRRLMLRVAEGLAAQRRRPGRRHRREPRPGRLPDAGEHGRRRRRGHPAAAAPPGGHRQGGDHRRGPPHRHATTSRPRPTRTAARSSNPGIRPPTPAPPNSTRPRRATTSRRWSPTAWTGGAPFVADDAFPCRTRAEDRKTSRPLPSASARLPPPPAPSRRGRPLPGRSGARLRRGGRRPGRRGDLHHRAPLPLPPGRPAPGRLVGRRPRRPAPGPDRRLLGGARHRRPRRLRRRRARRGRGGCRRSPSASASRSTTTRGAWTRWPTSWPDTPSTCCSGRCTGSERGASTRSASRSSTGSGSAARWKRSGTPTSPPSRSWPPPGPPTCWPTPTWPRSPASRPPVTSARGGTGSPKRRPRTASPPRCPAPVGASRRARPTRPPGSWPASGPPGCRSPPPRTPTIWPWWPTAPTRLRMLLGNAGCTESVRLRTGAARPPRAV